MAKIFITMEGGCIQNIFSDGPVEVYIADFDVEGVERDHPLLTSFDGDECLLGTFSAEFDAHAVSLAKKTWENTGK